MDNIEFLWKIEIRNGFSVETLFFFHQLICLHYDVLLYLN